MLSPFVKQAPRRIVERGWGESSSGWIALPHRSVVIRLVRSLAAAHEEVLSIRRRFSRSALAIPAMMTGTLSPFPSITPPFRDCTN